MLRLAALGKRFRVVVVTFTAAAVVLAIISQGLAAAAHIDGHSIHHGHFHHDHDHDDQGANEGGHHDEAVPPHCHFVSFLPRIENLPWVTGRPVTQGTEPPEILQAYFSLFERPPKTFVL